MTDSIVFSKTKDTLEVSVSVYVFKENDVYVAKGPEIGSLLRRTQLRIDDFACLDLQH